MYVIDSTSLLLISDHYKGHEPSIAALLDKLLELIKAHKVGFPTAVIRDCRSFEQSTYLGAWIQAASVYVKPPDVAYTWQEQAIDHCPEVVDYDADTNDHVDVLAYAYCLQQDGGLDVTVVTEDRGDLPTRSSLAEACDASDIPEIDLVEFLTRI